MMLPHPLRLVSLKTADSPLSNGVSCDFVRHFPVMQFLCVTQVVKVWNNNDVEIEESSDSSEISEAEEEEESFLMDTVHDQEQAGPSETQRTQPPKSKGFA
ncbi:hypothetical protein ILYODFUR_024115 [Ilyodon furcidens]|uniref:Uncharacterized protein n=1 Tax=Ilyodon furcidens TaxID=33524 RepID=A0ABV0V6N4_9TELE